MSENISIEITSDPLGNKQYHYLLHDGDVYRISRRWLSNCDQAIPKKGTLFHFGGKALVAIGDHLESSSIEAIDAKPFWRLRYILKPIGEWFGLIERRLVITLAVWNLVQLSPGKVPALHEVIRRWIKRGK